MRFWNGGLMSIFLCTLASFPLWFFVPFLRKAT